MRSKKKKDGYLMKSEVQLLIQNYIRNIQMNDYGSDRGIPQLYAVMEQIDNLPTVDIVKGNEKEALDLVNQQKAEIERLREIAQEPNANVREIAYAEWYYDPNGMDWGLGAWKCSKCHTKNDNLGMGNDINPYMFSGSKFCPQCGAVMKAKEVNENDR